MLTRRELYQLKWFLGGALTALALWSLWALDFNSQGYLLVGWFALGLTFLRPTLTERLSPRAWRLIGAIVLLLVVADFVRHVPDFMPPLLRMVVLILIYLVLAPRARREDLQLLLLSLFCLVLAGVLTLSLLFAFQILIFAPLAMSLLFVICLLDHGQESREQLADLSDFKLLQLMRRVIRVLDYRVVFFGGMLFAFVVAVSTVLFVLTPRFNLDQSLPFLQISGQARSGFSDTVGIGEVSEIIVDDSVALRVDVPSKAAVERAPYWRMLVLDQYVAGEFSLSDSLKGLPLRNFQKTSELMGRQFREESAHLPQRSGALWTLYWEGGISQYLPLPGHFYAMRFEGMQDLELLKGQQLIGLDAVKQRVFSYQIEDLEFSSRFPATLEEQTVLGASSENAGGVEFKYPRTTLELDLSPVELETLRTINRQIRADTVVDAASYGAAVQNYFSMNYRYSLRPSIERADRDPVVRWLEAGTAGHCELFAAGFVLLARAAGYPARMVVGFSGGAWNSVESYFVVRNSDAHAWAELYDSSSGEWLRVDPTPGNRTQSDLAAGAVTELVEESGWRAWVDSLRIQWYRRIVNFDQADQIDIANELQGFWQQFSARISERFQPLVQQFKDWVAHPISSASLMRGGSVLLSVAGLFLIWRLRRRWWQFFASLFGHKSALDPVRAEASEYLRRFNARGLGGVERDELKALRFGPHVDRAWALAVFQRARQALRNKK